VTERPQDLRRGQLYWAWLDPAVGSEQAGRRPVVIVSTDDLLVGPTAIVVPLSSRIPDRMPAFLVPLPRAQTGLARDSVALCHQVRALSVRRLVQPAGPDLGETDMRAIAGALRYALGLEDVD
jgi:mRNA interferase MazF